ncbi:MAG: hypothetical protein HY744_15185 [Deltaproteobacteria bacterium]|nr:hypothetical protein [Deltaproteobacteria bacterium]
MTGPIKAGARRVALALLVAAAAVAAALPWLRPPAPRTAPAAASASSGLATEPMAAVTAADAPLLAEGPVALLQPGELVLVRDRLPAMRWRGTVARRPASRAGGRLQVQRAPGEAVLVMFEGLRRRANAAPALCAGSSPPTARSAPTSPAGRAPARWRWCAPAA